MQNKPNFRKGEMGVSVCIKECYGDFQPFWAAEKQSQTKPIASRWPEIQSSKSEIRQLRLCSRTPVAPCWPGNETNECGMTALIAQYTERHFKNKANLPKEQNGVMLVIIMVYGDLDD